MYINWDKFNNTISAAILNVWLSVLSGSVTDSTFNKFDLVNMGVAVGVVLLASPEGEISVK